jgi:hypothetical protein
MIRLLPNKIPILALCYVLTLVSGCAGADGKNYFPLADGARWDYVGTVSSTARGRQISIRATARVDGETLIQGKRYFKHVLTSEFSGAPEGNKETEQVRYYRVADDGIYFRSGNNPEGPELLEMPLPIPVGTKWLSGTVEVQAEPAGTITVEGHEYRDCLKITYRQQGASGSLENYLAPGVGLIKARDVDETEPKMTVELTLKRYDP